MNSNQDSESRSTSDAPWSIPAEAQDLLRQLDRANDDTPSFPPAAEGLAELMTWMAEDESPAPTSGAAPAVNSAQQDPTASRPRSAHETVGYRGPAVCAATGITYRQLEYWARTGLVPPSVAPTHGRKSQQLYGLRDVVLLRIVKRLLDAGVSLQTIRVAVEHLRSQRDAHLARVTLLCDGSTIYECFTPEEVYALLQEGHGVFGIAVGAVVKDVTESLAELSSALLEPDGRPSDHSGPAAGLNDRIGMDDLARRRNRAG